MMPYTQGESDEDLRLPCPLDVPAPMVLAQLNKGEMRMPETADRLTVRVMELLEEAQHRSLTHAEVIEELVVSLRRDLAYLAWRAWRGRQTVYDEVEDGALRARARAIVLLQAQQEAGTT